MKYFNFFAILALIFVGCDTSTSETYTIENTLENTVKINFYSTGAISKPANELEGPGVLYTRTIKAMGANHLITALRGDSIRIVFDNNKVQVFCFYKDICEFNEIFNEENYISEGDSEFVYKITQENYDNATPCDGDCD